MMAKAKKSTTSAMDKQKGYTNGKNGADRAAASRNSGSRGGYSGNSRGKGKSYRKGKSTQKNSNAMENSNQSIATTPANDFSWYNNNPILTAGVAQLPFPNKPGMTFAPVQGTTGDGKVVKNIPKLQIGGVARYLWQPSIGQSSSPISPAALAAKEIYAKVRAEFSGRIYADPSDFILYIMAIDSISSFIASWKRVLRLLRAYNSDNYLVPDAVLAMALGIPENSFSSTGAIATLNYFKSHEPQLRNVVNQLIGMLYKLQLPDVFPIMKRHYWLNDNVFLDRPTRMSAMHMFFQDRYFVYTQPDATTPPYLANTTWLTLMGKTDITLPGGTTWYDEYTVYEAGLLMIEALANWDDAYTISGYLLRAYGDKPQFSIDMYVNEDFAPIYDELVLSQIHNMTVVEGDLTTASCNIATSGDSNAIIHEPVAKITGTSPFLHAPTLDIHADAPTIIDIVESSRLMTSMFPQSVDANGNYYVWGSTELVDAIDFLAPVIGRNFNGTSTIVSCTIDSNLVQAVTDPVLRVATAFDHAPMFFVVQKGGSDAQPTMINPKMLFQPWNINTFTNDDVRNLNRVCVLSQFNAFGL